MTEREIPGIISIIKNAGIPMGDIAINPDGSFNGRIYNMDALFAMVDVLRHGLADGISITANVIPAEPAPVYYGPQLPTEKEIGELSYRYGRDAELARRGGFTNRHRYIMTKMRDLLGLVTGDLWYYSHERFDDGRKSV